MASIGSAAELAGDNAFHLPVLAVDESRAGHAREDLDAQIFRLPRHPAAHIAHGDDVGAVVRHQRRHGTIGDAHPALGSEEMEIVLALGDSDWRIPLAPVRDERIEPARIEHRAGKDVGANLRAFLQHHQGDWGSSGFSRIAAARPAEPAPTITTS